MSQSLVQPIVFRDTLDVRVIVLEVVPFITATEVGGVFPLVSQYGTKLFARRPIRVQKQHVRRVAKRARHTVAKAARVRRSTPTIVPSERPNCFV